MNNKIIKLITMTAATGATMVVLAMPANAADGDETVFQNSEPYVCAELDILKHDDVQGLDEVLDHVKFASDVTTGDVTTGKDRKGLEGKLDSAQEKREAGKLCDAAAKIDDFGARVTRLKDGNTPKKLKIYDEYVYVDPDDPAKNDEDPAVTCLIIGAEHLAPRIRDGLNCGTADDWPRGKGPKTK